MTNNEGQIKGGNGSGVCVRGSRSYFLSIYLLKAGEWKAACVCFISQGFEHAAPGQQTTTRGRKLILFISWQCVDTFEKSFVIISKIVSLSRFWLFRLSKWTAY